MKLFTHVDIPKPNKGAEAWMHESDKLKQHLFFQAGLIALKYRAVAPKTSGELRGSASVSVGPTDYKQRKGRPMGSVNVNAKHAVWNLTGAGPGMHTHSTGRMPRYGPFKGDYTFEKILSKIGK